jgi:hypothetical protein
VIYDFLERFEVSFQFGNLKNIMDFNGILDGAFKTIFLQAEEKKTIKERNWKICEKKSQNFYNKDIIYYAIHHRKSFQENLKK